MKTKLSEKAKTKLCEEKKSDDVLKPKGHHSKSKRKKENTSHSQLKDDRCKRMQKVSPSISKSDKNHTCDGDIAPLETGKQVMFLRCINQEEAMKGEDFIFSIHYVDSVDNLVFDSVLLPKDFADGEKTTDSDSISMIEIEGSGLNNSNENPEYYIEEQELQMISNLGSNIDTKIPNKESEKGNDRHDKQDPVQSKEVISPSRFEETAAFNSGTKDGKANKSLEVRNENEDVVETVKNPDCLPPQIILITTSDIAENRVKLHSMARKSLKRNLKDEFADAILQSRGEKRYIVEVGCNDNLSSVATSTDMQKVVNGSANGNVNDIDNLQGLSSAKDTVSDCVKVSEKSNLESLKDGMKEQINGKELTEVENVTKSFKNRSMERKKSPRNHITPTSERSPKIGIQPTSHDRESNVPSLSTLQVEPLRKNCNENDNATDLCCGISYLTINIQKTLSPVKLSPIKVDCRKTPLNNGQTFTNDSKNANKTVNVEEKKIKDSELSDLQLTSVSSDNSSAKEDVGKSSHRKCLEKTTMEKDRDRPETTQELGVSNLHPKSVSSENSVSINRRSLRKRVVKEDIPTVSRRSLRKKPTSIKLKG